MMPSFCIMLTIMVHCCMMDEGMQPPPIIRSLSSHNTQSKPPLKSSLYYLSVIDLYYSSCPFSHPLLSFITSPQLFCNNLPNHHLALRPKMDGQFEGRLSAALADRSRTQHQGGAASITLRPAGGQAPKWHFCKCNEFNQRW